VVVAIDQGTKGLVDELIVRGDRVEALPVISFENARNEGIAFGLADGASTVLIGLTLVLLVGLLVGVALRSPNHRLVWLPAGLLVGGALGNLADRVRQGSVTDFIDLPAWPTFNLADVAIVAGVVLLFFVAHGETGEEE